MTNSQQTAKTDQQTNENFNSFFDNISLTAHKTWFLLNFAIVVIALTLNDRTDNDGHSELQSFYKVTIWKKDYFWSAPNLFTK